MVCDATGAGQGVGAAIAERLAAAGAHLALVDRQENLVREVAGKIAEDHGHEARHYTCDVRDRAALADVIKDAATMTGRIEVLVNNAGRWISGPFVDSAPLTLPRQWPAPQITSVQEYGLRVQPDGRRSNLAQ